MAGDFNLYKNGCDNLATVTSTSHVTPGSGTIATAIMVSGPNIVSGSDGSVFAAYKDLWERLNDGQTGLVPSLTTTQIAALTGIDDGVQVIDSTLGRLDVCIGGVFSNAAGQGTMAPSAFGEMVEDNASGSDINVTTKVWDTASVGDLDPNGLVTFVNGTNEDYLLVGTGGAGTYQIHFSVTFTNAGGNVTSAGIHKNSSEVGKMEDTHAGDSAEHRDLRGQGFLVLADADQIKLHVVSATPSDVVTAYHAHITMKRMT